MRGRASLVRSFICSSAKPKTFFVQTYTTSPFNVRSLRSRRVFASCYVAALRSVHVCVCVLSVALINEAVLICTLTHLIAGNLRKTFLCLSMNMRTHKFLFIY